MENGSDSRIMVSVAVLTYNHEQYVRKTIDSILRQKTDFKYEILIHDDASTDGTAGILYKYKEKYPDKIRLFIQKENQYQKGIKRVFDIFLLPAVRGKYVALCEGDDFWTDQNKLQKQFDFMECHKEIVLHMHAARVVSTDGRQTGRFVRTLCESRVVTLEQDIDKFFATASKFYRTDVMRDMPECYFIGDAGDFPSYVITLTRGKAYYENTVMSAYRINVENSSNDRLVKMDGKEQISYYNERIRFLRELDKQTVRRFHRSLSKAEVLEEWKKVIAIHELKGRIRLYWNLRKMEGYRYVPLVHRMKLAAFYFMPGYQILSAIKGGIREKMNRIQMINNK